MLKNVLFAGFFSLMSLCPFQKGEACTSFQIQAKDGTRLYCRSMEFGFDLKSNLLIVPRGMTYTGTAPDGKPGAKWTTQYGFVGMNLYLTPTLVTDGMNEKGLVVGVLYLPNFAEYQKPVPNAQDRTIGSWEVCNYLLATCASVEEAKAALQKIIVAQQPLPNSGGFIPPLHFTIQDKKGGSVVAEYVKGELRLFDNPLMVITNSPPFDWHINNLTNYVNLTPVNSPAMKIREFLIPSYAQGTGLLGLPGDYTPPSRFVRAAFFSGFAYQPSTDKELVNLGLHIMNSFDIFKGVIQSKDNDVQATVDGKPLVPQGSTMSELTQWITLHDMTHLTTYFRTYGDLRIKQVELSKLPFDSKDFLMIPAGNEMVFENVTAQTSPLKQ